MKIVYATGQPRHFEFAIVSNRIHIPKEATIPAVIDGERTDNQLDEHVFNAIDDQEYYELQKLIHEAQLSECKPNNMSGATRSGFC
jgi:hypothetical protein